MKTAEELLKSKILVKGHIRRVTYKEADYTTGGFAIIKFVCEEVESGEIPEEICTVIDECGYPIIPFSGYTPSLSTRLTYEIRGELIKHEKFGYQYKILLMTEKVTLDTPEDVAKFLIYVYPDITAQNILSTLSNPIKALEEGDIKTLIKVKGIGPHRAAKIIDKYKEVKLNTKAYVALFDYGFTQQMIKRLVTLYGSPEALINRIEKNPYNLIYDVRGISWNKADQIAANIGIVGADPRRIEAYIYYLLIKDGQDNGNTYMDLDEMFDFVLDQVPEIGLNDVSGYLLKLIKAGKLVYEKNTRRIGLMEYRITEERIADQLYRISTAPVLAVDNIDDVIAECEEKVGFQYSDEQREAIHKCLSKNINIVSGKAGCGKSSIMYPVTQILQLNGMGFAQCALSGKAALNLTSITGVEGSTIHRLLGYEAETNEFRFNENHQLNLNMIILDETSMVDESLFLSLLKAIPNSCKLILLGDTGQLEPIGLGCLFRDLINSECISHVHFTKIFRQAQLSGIISEAAKVYDGFPIVSRNPKKREVQIRGALEDFKYIPVGSAEEARAEMVAEYSRFMETYHAKPQDIIVVTGKRVNGETSARSLNTAIQKLVNNESTTQDYVITKRDGDVFYDVTFRPGDQVLVTKNCYDTYDLNGDESPVFNGNIGKIIKIKKDSMIINFLQGAIDFPVDYYQYLELGYAITAHKIQGSGVPYVITICDWGSYTLLSKEWLYTAITRAKKFHTLIGMPRAILHACDHTGIVFKKTWLCDLIKDTFDGTRKVGTSAVELMKQEKENEKT